MHLLKKVVPFLWDEDSQNSFEALKKNLMLAPLLILLDYTKYSLLYLVASDFIVGIVLVQYDYNIPENIIYYFSYALITIGLKYLHVEKLALVVVFPTQRFHNYILLRKTTIVADVNLFQYFLT